MGNVTLSTTTTSFDNDSTIKINVAFTPVATVTKSNIVYGQYTYDSLKTNYSNVDNMYTAGGGSLKAYVGLFLNYNGVYYGIAEKECSTSWNVLTTSEATSAGLSKGSSYTPTGSSTTYYDTWYVKSTSASTGSVTFTVPRYIANGTNLYAAVATKFSSTKFYYKRTNDGKETSTTGEILENGSYAGYNAEEALRGTVNNFNGFAHYINLGSCSRSYTMDTPSISYPSFSSSSKRIIKCPAVYNAYKVVLQKSINNGTSWTDIYTNSTGTSLNDSTTWSISLCDDMLTIGGYGGDIRSYTTNVTAPIPAINYTDTDSSSKAIYRVAYTGATTVTKTGGTSEILDLTTTTPSEIPNVASYSNRTTDTLTISKTSITDRTRVKFREAFVYSSLPNTSFTANNTNLTYNLHSLDNNKSLSTNLSNYFTLPNGNYEYRIYPSLDGVENYVSSTGTNYISIYYNKTTSSMEMIRPIEMGSQMPETLKLIINPAKENIPSGSSFNIYVANNGNDTTPVWEELPKTCIGSTSNAEVDTYQFSNTSKTADTWKLLIKVVADKGTAASHFYLTYMNAIINGGEKAESAYDKLETITLDANASQIDIDLPAGYTRYKILGSVIPSNTNGYPTFKVNDLTSGYNTMQLRSANSTTATLSKSTATNNAGYAGYTPTANAFMYFEVDLSNVINSNGWQISSVGYAYTGITFSHSRITTASALSKFTIYPYNASYPFVAGSSITVMGVK